MDVRAFGASGIPWKPKSKDPLFSDEEGGVEPGDLPISPKMAAQFGFQSGTITPDTDNAAARAGVAARAYQPTLQDPGMERRAAFGMDPAGNPARTPTRQESAEDDAYVAAQMAPVQAADERIARGNQQDAAFSAQTMAQDQAEAQLTAFQRRQALLMTLENKLGIPIDEKALQELVKEKLKQDENEGVLADIYTMFEDEQKDIEQIPQGPTAEAQKAMIRQHYREKRDRLQNIRTRRAVQLSKEPAQADENDILSLVNAPGGP